MTLFFLSVTGVIILITENKVIFLRIFLISISPKTTNMLIPCTGTRNNLRAQKLDQLRRHSRQREDSEQNLVEMIPFLRDLCCPQAARAVPLVYQNDKVESMGAEQILGSGKSTAVSEPTIITLCLCFLTSRKEDNTVKLQQYIEIFRNRFVQERRFQAVSGLELS